MEAARQEVARARGLGEAGEAARWRQEAARQEAARQEAVSGAGGGEAGGRRRGWLR